MKQLLTIFLLILSVSAFGYEEQGEASWYGGKFQGRTTANGEIFDTNLFTAAHKTLPFNSLVKVTNQENNLSVIVRINDRGPYIEGRIIDLSMAAAEIIGLIRLGHSPVLIEVIGSSDINPTKIDQEKLNPDEVAEDDKNENGLNNSNLESEGNNTAAKTDNKIPSFETENDINILSGIQDKNIISEEYNSSSVTKNTDEENYLNIQVGSFSIEENAGNLKNLLESKDFTVQLEKLSSGFTRVIILQIHSKELEKIKQILVDMGITDMIVRIENNS